MKNIKIDTAANRIRKAMELRGMKQADLVEKTGINKGSISSYLSGRYEPKQNALYDLGVALDVAEMWLAGYDIPMERPLAQKKNDNLVEIVAKLRADNDFFEITSTIAALDQEQRSALKTLLTSLMK